MVLAIELSDGIWVLYPKIYSLAHNGAGLAFPMLHLCVSYFLELGPIPKYTSAIGDYRKSTHAEQGHKNSQLNSEKILKPIRRSMQDLQANYSLWCNIIPSPDSFVASNRCTVEDLVSCQEPMINVETWEEGVNAWSELLLNGISLIMIHFERRVGAEIWMNSYHIRSLAIC